MTDSGPPLHLEPARLGHVRDVRALDHLVYPTSWSAEMWQREIERPANEACYVVATQRLRHVGHAGLLVQADDGHVVTVAVDPGGQRRGVATHMMLVLARRAVRLGLDALTLEVRVSNTAARELYRRFGFAPAGSRPGYYDDDGEDALVMWAHGIAEPAYAARLDEIAGAAGDVSWHPALTAATRPVAVAP